jgi:hypothetical protein
MRKIILIAAMALTSAAAQAGETRNLSSASVPSVAPATIQTKQLQGQNEAPFATPAKPVATPRYSLPASETQMPTTASTAPSTAVPSTAQPERRYDDRGYYDDAGYHPFPRRHADAHRYAKRPHGYTNWPYHRTQWNARRIIAELLRYGIYW